MDGTVSQRVPEIIEYYVASFEFDEGLTMIASFARGART